MLFEYLTVLVSVVVGLSLTHFLTALIRIVHNRDTVRPYWVQLLWSGTIILWTISFWWFTFAMSNVQRWSLSLFAFVMLYAVMLYMLVALLFPEDIDPDEDYESLFFENKTWFFSALLVFLVIDLFDFWMRIEAGVDIVTLGPYLGFIGPLILFSIIAIRSANRRFHAFFALQALVWVIGFMALTLPALEST
jgi:hypothetical protein